MGKVYHQVRWDAELEEDCRQLIRLAVREDLRRAHDWTTISLVDDRREGAAWIVAREAGVLAGGGVVSLVVEEMELELECDLACEDGAALEPGTCVGRLAGNARDLLTGERILLNFLGRLCGIATLTQQYLKRVAHTEARLYDTRKTTPGWRLLEKYAVRCGGGWNHRRGLYDGILIKDNHLALAAENSLSVSQALERSRKFLADLAPHTAVPSLIVEVEVDHLNQFRTLLEGPAEQLPDIVLLDNMPPEQLRQAVALRDAAALPRGRLDLEASGGVNLETIAEIAESGVDRISVGALTHSARALDLGLDWEAASG